MTLKKAPKTVKKGTKVEFYDLAASKNVISVVKSIITRKLPNGNTVRIAKAENKNGSGLSRILSNK